MSAAQLVEVAVTVHVPGRFHYRVPPHLAARTRVGTRVLVKFGGRKLTGVVVRMGVPAPPDVVPVDISEVIDDAPLPAQLIELCLWIADYYEAPIGEVVRAALPAGSGVSARHVYGLTAAGQAVADGEGAALPAKQRVLIMRLADAELPTAGASAAIKRVLDELVKRGLVEVRDQRANARAKLKRERVVSLVADVEAARAATARSPKKRAVIEALALLADADADADTDAETETDADADAETDAETDADADTAADSAERRPIALDALERSVPGAKTVLRELAKAGLVSLSDREMRLEAVATGLDMQVSTPPTLTGEQATAVREITDALTPAEGVKFTPFLLHGVTGSGKTEVYLRVIAAALEQKKTALVLVPEISLTPQLAARFRARFGDEVAILHSGLSEQARLGEWSRLMRGEARIAVGARSAVFAPLTQLGVIVVDEEHDGSFKQDEGVRYNARDVAIVRAQRAGAVCVLGSGTPSLESAAHAQSGHYRLLRLTERPMARPMPAVEIVDLRTHLPDPESFLSAQLRDAIAATVEAGDQVILFLNRRGFATFVLCRACGHAFRCPDCSVSLTYHRSDDCLTCHYCAHTKRVPEQCPSCKAHDTIQRKGLGTEKVAASVAEAFPQARVGRLDRDVASGAKVEAVLSRVARREIDILVGTQMVTKGHDFPGVTLVGVLCADTGLDLPDFRASERTFQLLAQVAGRAGRGDRPGRVMIQTYRPDAPAVVAAAAHDYQQFYEAEVVERKERGYPPHGRLIVVRIDGANEHEVAGIAQQIANRCEAVAARPELAAPVEVLGPVPAPLAKLRGRTRWQLWLRSRDRTAVRAVARAALAVEVPRSARVGLDVDPISAM
jgi:primosomal protein N' (replication factor Y)